MRTAGLILFIAVALGFDFTNGFHDAANAVAASIATRAIRPISALLMAAGLNVVGALVSTKVAATVGEGIISTEVGTHGLVIVFSALIGAIIGLVMYIYPRAVGGGEELTEAILIGEKFLLSVIVGYLLLRFVAGPLSYSAPVVGGLFAPMLAVGALWGIFFIEVVSLVWPGDIGFLAVPMAVVGMASFFGASVRAPMTGMVLVLEMTASTAAIVPILAATASAVLVAYLVGSPPIYDSLRERSLSKY